MFYVVRQDLRNGKPLNHGVVLYSYRSKARAFAHMRKIAQACVKVGTAPANVAGTLKAGLNLTTFRTTLTRYTILQEL